MQNITMTSGLRRNNRRRIYQYLYQKAIPVTKQQISEELSLSMPTVSKNLNDFIKEGLIAYTGTMASTGGRKPRTLSLVSDACFAVGISVMDNAVRMVAIDIYAKELAYRKLYIKFSHEAGYYKQISHELQIFLKDFRLLDRRLLGVGCTVPGIIDRERDRLLFAPTLGIRDIPLAEIYQYFTEYPFFIENDANASGYAEIQARRGNRNLIYLSLERGIGGAVLLGNTRYAGDHGRSGEFGHICIVPEGKLCGCGRRGCLEAYCSASRLSDDLGISLGKFFELLRQREKSAVETWEEYIHHLTDGLAMIRMWADCSIVLGGMVAAYLEDYLEEIRQETYKKTLFDQNGEFLSLASFASHGACLGAAMHYIHELVEQV